MQFKINVTDGTFCEYLSGRLYSLDKSFQVTAAIAAPSYKIEEGLDVPVLNQYLDAIHIMSYDFHGTWDNPKIADNHAPLYARSWDTNPPLTGNAA